MARYILEIRKELGLSMILVEHDMHMVMDLADRVMALDFGVPIATGAPADIQADPRVVEAYLGGTAGTSTAALEEAVAEIAPELLDVPDVGTDQTTEMSTP